MTNLDRFQAHIVLSLLESLERSGEKALLTALAIVACVLMAAAFVWAWAKGRR